MRILIVDDDERLGESLTDYLTHKGHEAHFAPSSGEALWLQGLFRFEAALVDFDLGASSGLDLARRLKARDPGLAILVVSGRDVEEDVLRERGGFSFLLKPIEPEEILDTLLRMVPRAEGSALMPRASFSILRIEEPEDLR